MGRTGPGRNRLGASKGRSVGSDLTEALLCMHDAMPAAANALPLVSTHGHAGLRAIPSQTLGGAGPRAKQGRSVGPARPWAQPGGRNRVGRSGWPDPAPGGRNRVGRSGRPDRWSGGLVAANALPLVSAHGHAGLRVIPSQTLGGAGPRAKQAGSISWAGPAPGGSWAESQTGSVGRVGPALGGEPNRVGRSGRPDRWGGVKLGRSVGRDRVGIGLEPNVRSVGR